MRGRRRAARCLGPLARGRPMRRRGERRLDTQTTSRFVIAVFDEWDALHAALEDLGMHGIAPRGAVLFARDDGPDRAAIVLAWADLLLPRRDHGAALPVGEAKGALHRGRARARAGGAIGDAVRAGSAGRSGPGSAGSTPTRCRGTSRRAGSFCGSSLRSPRIWASSVAGWFRRARTWWECATLLHACERRESLTSPDHR